MGLDMYAYTTHPAILLNRGTKTSFHFWRKHPNLHGWMRDLYVRKGGKVLRKPNTLQGLDVMAYSPTGPVTRLGKPLPFDLARYDKDIEGICAAEIQANPSGDTFNRVPVQLSNSDLDDLEHAVRNGTLPHTTGMMFGRSDGSERSDDLEFISKARAALLVGRAVWYNSDW